jgi:hypothetical protein
MGVMEDMIAEAIMSLLSPDSRILFLRSPVPGLARGTLSGDVRSGINAFACSANSASPPSVAALEFDAPSNVSRAAPSRQLEKGGLKHGIVV